MKTFASRGVSSTVFSLTERVSSRVDWLPFSGVTRTQSALDEAVQSQLEVNVTVISGERAATFSLSLSSLMNGADSGTTSTGGWQAAARTARTAIAICLVFMMMLV